MKGDAPPRGGTSLKAWKGDAPPVEEHPLQISKEVETNECREI